MSCRTPVSGGLRSLAGMIFERRLLSQIEAGGAGKLAGTLWAMLTRQRVTSRIGYRAYYQRSRRGIRGVRFSIRAGGGVRLGGWTERAAFQPDDGTGRARAVTRRSAAGC